MNKERYEFLAKNIFESSLEVHKIMGPGLLESVYEICLMREFELRNIPVEVQFPIKLRYKEFEINKEYRADLLIDNSILIELKAVEYILPIHEAQLISYLKLGNYRMGFLINFNVPLLKNGFKRFVNNY